MGRHHPNPWTTKEIKTLKSLAGQGWSAVAIYKHYIFPRHTKSSINGVMQKLGLGSQKHRKRIAEADRKTPEERNAILLFLMGPGKLMPSWDVASVLGISQRMVTYYRKKHLRFKLPSKVCYSSEHFKQTHIKMCEARKAGFKEWNAKRWEQRQEYLLRQLERDAQFGEIREYRQCSYCKQRWPLSPVYFHTEKHRKTEERIITFHCRSCDRRKKNSDSVAK